MAALAPLNLLVVLGAHSPEFCRGNEAITSKVRNLLVNDEDPSSSGRYLQSMHQIEPDPELAPDRGESDGATRGEPPEEGGRFPPPLHGRRDPTRRALGELSRDPWQPECEPDPRPGFSGMPATPASASAARCAPVKEEASSPLPVAGLAHGTAVSGSDRPSMVQAPGPGAVDNGFSEVEIEALALGKLPGGVLPESGNLEDAVLWSDVLHQRPRSNRSGPSTTSNTSDRSRLARGKASVAGFSDYICQRLCPNMIMVPKSLLNLDANMQDGILLKLGEVAGQHQSQQAKPRAFTLVLSHDNVAALLVISMLSILGAIYLWKICTRRRCTCRLCRNQYRVLHLLGSGGYGSVHLVDRISDGTRLVAKKIEVRELMDLDEYTREAKDLVTLRHRHIVSYEEDFVHIEYGTLEPKTYFIIVMEYCPEGDLKEKIELDFGSFTEEWVRTVFAQLLQAVQYLHSKNVIHRDLKSQNVFLASDGRVRLGDFGLCRHTRRRDLNTATLTHAGTDCYMAPEMLSSSRYGKPADIWSLGCVLYELCTGHFMWELDGILGAMVMQDPHKVSKLVQANVVPAIGQPLTSLLKRLLSVNPASRPTVTTCIRRKLFKRSFPLSRVPFGDCFAGSEGPASDDDGAPHSHSHSTDQSDSEQRNDNGNDNSRSSSNSSSSSSSESSKAGPNQYPPARNEDLPRRRRRNRRARSGRHL